MAFKLRNLVVLNYGNGFTSWHYRPSADETPLNILETGYFSDASDLIAQGDKITVSTTQNERLNLSYTDFKKHFFFEGVIFGTGKKIKLLLSSNIVYPDAFIEESLEQNL